MGRRIKSRSRNKKSRNTKRKNTKSRNTKRKNTKSRIKYSKRRKKSINKQLGGGKKISTCNHEGCSNYYWVKTGGMFESGKSEEGWYKKGSLTDTYLGMGGVTISPEERYCSDHRVEGSSRQWVEGSTSPAERLFHSKEEERWEKEKQGLENILKEEKPLQGLLEDAIAQNNNSNISKYIEEAFQYDYPPRVSPDPQMKQLIIDGLSVLLAAHKTNIQSDEDEVMIDLKSALEGKNMEKFNSAMQDKDKINYKDPGLETLLSAHTRYLNLHPDLGGGRVLERYRLATEYIHLRDYGHKKFSDLFLFTVATSGIDLDQFALDQEKKSESAKYAEGERRGKVNFFENLEIKTLPRHRGERYYKNAPLTLVEGMNECSGEGEKYPLFQGLTDGRDEILRMWSAGKVGEKNQRKICGRGYTLTKKEKGDVCCKKDPSHPEHMSRRDAEYARYTADMEGRTASAKNRWDKVLVKGQGTSGEFIAEDQSRFVGWTALELAMMNDDQLYEIATNEGVDPDHKSKEDLIKAILTHLGNQRRQYFQSEMLGSVRGTTGVIPTGILKKTSMSKTDLEEGGEELDV